MIRNCIQKSPSLIKQSSNICYQTKLNNFRENRSYGKEKRIESIQKFYDSTRSLPGQNPSENIDSHDNSMYHKSLTNMKCKGDFEVCVCLLNGYNSSICPYVKDSKGVSACNNYPVNMDNYNYYSKGLVEDYNKKWNKKLTLEEYYKNLKFISIEQQNNSKMSPPLRNNYPYIKDNYPLNIKTLVEDFNKRCKTNLTMY